MKDTASKTLTLKTLNKSNVWDIQENDIFRIGYTTIKAGYFEENLASGRVMEKSGMHKVEHTDTIEYRGTTHLCINYEISR